MNFLFFAQHIFQHGCCCRQPKSRLETIIGKRRFYAKFFSMDVTPVPEPFRISMYTVQHQMFPNTVAQMQSSFRNPADQSYKAKSGVELNLWIPVCVVCIQVE